MRLQLVVLLALLALSAQSVASDSANTSEAMGTAVSSSSSSCAPINTLTFDCPNVCGATQQPCIRYASRVDCERRLGGAGETLALSACASYASSSSSASANTSACGVECFRASDRALATAFTFLIPFSRASLGAQPPANATNGVLSKNEDALERIAVLDVPATTTAVTIAGGTSASASVKGRVVETTLANWLLTSKTQLRSVTIANVNVTLLPEEMFPMTLTDLTLANLYLTTLPTDLPAMVQLQRLNVTQNNLQSFPTKFGLPSLTTLDVSSNNLNKFDAVSRDLEYLDLSNNVLESVPMSIFQMPKLRYLNLRANAFTGVVLSPAQLAFLQNVSTLVIDSFGPLACAAAAQQTLESATVCVDDRISTAAVVHTRSSSSDATLIAVVIASVAAMALVVIGSVVWLRQRRQDDAAAEKLGDGTETASVKGSTVTQSPYVEAQTPSNDLHATTMSSSLSSARQTLWDDHDLVSLQVPVDDIEDVRRIGAGAFAVVWLVHYRKMQLAASKRLKRDERTWQRTQSFVAEIKLVARLDHERIVRLIGVAWTIESDLQALFEYMASGDVRTYLVDSAEDFCGVWTAEKLAIVRHVAEALVYLHSFMPPLVHRDLKSRNILLSDDMSAKVSDFGVSRFQSEHETMTSGVGTGKWLAPEVLAGNGDYNQASDIYALGVVLSEMDTHELPYAGLRGPADNALSEVAVLQMVAAGTLRPNFTRECPAQIRALADACLAFDPTTRPTAYQVTFALRSIEASGDY